MSSLLNDILEQNSENLKNRNILSSDIEEMLLYYQKIIDLQNKYKNSVIERNEIAKEIENMLSILNKFLTIFKNQIEGEQSDYKYYTELITDAELALRIIVRLANQKEIKYDLRKYTVTDVGTFGENNKYNGNIWVISKIEELDKLNSMKSYSGNIFSRIATDILEKGNSLIILNDHCHEVNVEPIYYHLKNVEFLNLKTYFVNNGISCFFYDGELKKAILQFYKFINNNGADIKGINEDILFETIKNDSNVVENVMQQEKDKSTLVKKLIP